MWIHQHSCHSLLGRTYSLKSLPSTTASQDESKYVMVIVAKDNHIFMVSVRLDLLWANVLCAKAPTIFKIGNGHLSQEVRDVCDHQVRVHLDWPLHSLLSCGQGSAPPCRWCCVPSNLTQTHVKRCEIQTERADTGPLNLGHGARLP